MLRYLFSFSALFACLNLPAQTDPPAAPQADQKRIALTAVIPEEAETLPAPARPILLSRLGQLATTGGYASTAESPQFILAANPVLIDKKVAGTAPRKIHVELELNLYIADYYSKNVFTTTSVSLRGIGATDAEAYTDAFRGFQTGKKELRDFTQNGRTEIIAYYENQCDFILSKVDMLVKTNQADAALDMLMHIPEVSKTCFDKAMAKSESVYLASAEQHCQKLLQAARAAWANAPDRSGAEKAAMYISVIPAQAKCRADADTLLREIKAKMQESENWERQQYRDQLDLMRRYIAALRDVGVAYGSGQPDTQVVVKGWLW